MPRRREVPKREVLPDPKYNDRLVTKCVNSLMVKGKKSIAEGILYDAFDAIEKRAARMVEATRRAVAAVEAEAEPAAAVAAR